MHFHRSFVILLANTASFLLNAELIKAEKTIVGCTGKLLQRTNFGSRNFPKIYHNLNAIQLPERFDAREKWRSCRTLHHIKFQGSCGGCWAFASSSVMADRLCIATGGAFDKPLSEQHLMECCHSCVVQGGEGGCTGGYFFDAFEFWKDQGIVTGVLGCKPIEEFVIRGIPQKECRQRCTNESYNVEYGKDRTFSVKTLVTNPAQKSDIPHIMAEIMLNGPVVGGMKIYEYLYNVPSNAILYYDARYIKNGEIGTAHAIKIIGWDNIGGIPVWIIANSWGPNWCNKGFCYVRRGNNDLDIEETFQFSAGIPKVIIYQKKHKKHEKTASDSNIIKITNLIEIVLLLCILSI